MFILETPLYILVCLIRDVLREFRWFGKFFIIPDMSVILIIFVGKVWGTPQKKGTPTKNYLLN